MNLLSEMEVILSDDTAVVLSTSVESKYLIVILQSSPADSFIEICTVEASGIPHLSSRSRLPLGIGTIVSNLWRVDFYQ